MHADETYPRPLLKSPLGFFSESFKTNPILRKYFRRFAGTEKFRIIEEAVQRYEHKLSLEDLIHSGMLRPRPASEPETTSGDMSAQL